MRRKWCILILLLPVLEAAQLGAQTLWDRREPNMSTLFHDYRARNVGDVLTVFIEETTGFDAQEKREMDKKTSSDM
ncbi:MAG TPA: flagellar basal body L-ring protein FlgH, partial [Gemmataceae bacterium]|nr:flagellar basal body L-ring protein FlgH [Gemmataceae bacterium]